MTKYKLYEMGVTLIAFPQCSLIFHDQIIFVDEDLSDERITLGHCNQIDRVDAEAADRISNY